MPDKVEKVNFGQIGPPPTPGSDKKQACKPGSDASSSLQPTDLMV